MEISGQNDTGLRRLLTFSLVYEFFQQKLLGGDHARKWVMENIWKLHGEEKIIDIGCGPATIMDYLPDDVSYLGIDISENYIRSARRKFSARGTFFLGTAREFLDQDHSHLSSASLVLCNGLLHHLPDNEVLEVLELAKQLMKPGGRLICLEATFLARQTRLSKWMVSADRGRHIRSEQEWKDLIGRAFGSFTTRILTGLIRIPYTHIIIECSKGGSSGKKGDAET